MSVTEFISPTMVKRTDSVIPESVNVPVQQLYEDILAIKLQLNTAQDNIRFLMGGGVPQ